MPKNSRKTSRQKPLTTPVLFSPTRWVIWVLAAASLAAVLAGFWWTQQKPDGTESSVRRSRGLLTFNKDIAPIIFYHCAGCHRPGQPAPFSLLTYSEVKKHAKEIADVTTRGYMPPWLPEPGYGEFIGNRRLSARAIELIQQWVAQGAVEGAREDLPPAPAWNSDWNLGEPDLVVTIPEAYTLPAQGRDVYRNLITPIPVTTTHYVRGVELRPGNLKVVHHAFVQVDSTPESRRLDAEDPGPGYGGMNRSGAVVPGGHFLGWQPGRLPSFVPDGLAWQLDPGMDLALELHMNPSGKPEQVQPSVGFYFTDKPPTNSCYKAYLTSYVIDIPAGESNYVVQDTYKLPVDLHALAILPHAHYLAKEMQGWATLPDGTKQWLIWIKQWDFNWQTDYRYATPIYLPKGTTLQMRFTYDNSTNNVHNPHHPPKAVTYGPQSTDEMAELWIQVLPRNDAELSVLKRDFEAKTVRLFEEHDWYDLRKNPNDPKAHEDLGILLLSRNDLAQAESHLRAAIQIARDYAPAHYGLGLVLRRQNRLAEAISEFQIAVQQDPKDFKAQGNLGFIYLEMGEYASARVCLENALRLNPNDSLARTGLDQALKAQGLR